LAEFGSGAAARVDESGGSRGRKVKRTHSLERS